MFICQSCLVMILPPNANFVFDEENFTFAEMNSVKSVESFTYMCYIDKRAFGFCPVIACASSNKKTKVDKVPVNVTKRSFEVTKAV